MHPKTTALASGQSDKEKARVEEIKTLHQEIVVELRTSLEKIIRIGGLLEAQKKVLKHGNFTAWIKKNLPFTDRTARNYMTIFRKRSQLSKSETLSVLAIPYHRKKTIADEVVAKEKVRPARRSFDFDEDGIAATQQYLNSIAQEYYGGTITVTVKKGQPADPRILSKQEIEPVGRKVQERISETLDAE